jgi:iron complex transport system substrate-binding protein
MPDLILISATGGDSALALYDQLSAIAPTLIINYDDKSWQALLTQLGRSPARKNRPQRALPSLINSSRR